MYIKRQLLKCEACRIKYKYCECFLENRNFKEDLIEYKGYNKNYEQKFDEKLKGQFLNTYTFSNLTMITISLFYCYEKVFILMNIWMIWKNSMKQHYRKKTIFTVT